MAELNTGGDISKVRKLGRGLSALLQTPVRVDVPVVAEVNRVVAVLPESGGGAVEVSVPRGGGGGGGVESVGVDEIVPSRFQARKVFDEAGLRGLVESIRKTGVMQPVIVRPVGGKYELVAGERRWRAAKIVGLARVPAIVRELGDEESAEWGLVENIQREDLNPMDRAAGLRMMSDRFGMTHGQIAERVGLERATVANLVRLTELEADIAELLSRGALTAAHGKALLGVEAGAGRIDLAREAVRGDWSVRQLTAAAAQMIRKEKSGGVENGAVTKGDAQASGTRAVVVDLERRLSQQLGTKVEISMNGSGKKGKIMIEFYGLDHFDGLVGKMGLR